MDRALHRRDGDVSAIRIEDEARVEMDRFGY
jgi:hypothetical protein